MCREASVSTDYPRYDSTSQKCFKVLQWRQCVNYPKIVRDKVTGKIPFPNEFIAWFRMHTGLSSALVGLTKKLEPSYKLDYNDKAGVCKSIPITG